jgi:hypothetical protein
MTLCRHFHGVATFTLTAALITSGVVAGQSKAKGIEGVWRTVEVTATGPNGGVFKPQANLAIFSGRHYSRTEVHAEQPRPALADAATATADQLRAVWGPFVAEAGTFDISGGTLTMRPLVAKNPAAMTPDAFTAYDYVVSGNTMTLLMKSTQQGPIPNPVTVKLVRVE